MLNVCDLFLVLRTNTWLNCFNFSWDTRGAWINKHKTTVIYLLSVILVMIPRLDGTVCLEGLFHSSFHIKHFISDWNVQYFQFKSTFTCQNICKKTPSIKWCSKETLGMEVNFFIFEKLIACFVLRNNIGKVFVFFLPASS